MYAQDVAPFRVAASAEYHRELLVRMIDDDGDLIEPMAFIPVAERYNLMPAFDRLVIATVFEHCAKLFAAEVRTKKVRWAINLSGASLNEEISSILSARSSQPAHSLRRDLL